MRPSAKKAQWSRACVHTQPSLLEIDAPLKKKKKKKKMLYILLFPRPHGAKFVKREKVIPRMICNDM